MVMSFWLSHLPVSKRSSSQEAGRYGLGGFTNLARHKHSSSKNCYSVNFLISVISSAGRRA